MPKKSIVSPFYIRRMSTCVAGALYLTVKLVSRIGSWGIFLSNGRHHYVSFYLENLRPPHTRIRDFKGGGGVV